MPRQPNLTFTPLIVPPIRTDRVDNPVHIIHTLITIIIITPARPNDSIKVIILKRKWVSAVYVFY